MCVNDVVVHRRRAAVLPRLLRLRQAGRRRRRAGHRRHRRRLPGGRLRAGRRRDRRAARHVRRRRIRPGRLLRRRRRAGRQVDGTRHPRRRSAARPGVVGAALERLLAGAARAARPHAAAAGRRAARARRTAAPTPCCARRASTSARCARCTTRACCAGPPTSRAAGWSTTRRACCPTARACSCASGPAAGRCRRSSICWRAAATSTRRDAAHVQHGHRHAGLRPRRPRRRGDHAAGSAPASACFRWARSSPPTRPTRPWTSSPQEGRRVNVGVLVSGSGTNLQALIDAAAAASWAPPC